jgi:GntR family transcriptional regulator
MLFKVQRESLVPVYEQIFTQIIFGIAAGDLEVGELIPSVRELGARLVVNPNTMARAYRELEQRGIVVTRPGKGMEVTSEAPLLCQEARQEIIRGRIREALREAAASALPVEEVRRLVDEELTRTNGKPKAVGG